ncbi:MAG: exodeoxyribonuclease VII large subunit [Candidatus Liberibacter europaeus]|uniref:Exodeoxyribonuclease 7 large subunit n=1 Tax=Candidatus Liberibacter europaeus TaxID=744859 RepID=A0A2T4VZ22_9HYPH|nr:exodeoxyribonuclease VII large subunit [Candidatus Liberibacter europaeus]PTL87015.1 MAG: exodeoxyribonuclease VII large subunit [Candidatus Liberibacter europaeus]
MAYFTKTNSLNHIEYSVSELSYHIKHTLESNFSYVCVKGEISGYKKTNLSGHAYFSLKDNQSKIDAVIWKRTLNKMDCHPKEGIECLAFGKITNFHETSRYQIIIESLIPSGAGALMTVLEERKRKLREEGLFSAERKKPIPFIPKTIAVITSPTGAVIRDILQRIFCRFPTRMLVFPVKVQGYGCSQEISNAICQLNALKEDDTCPKPDVIIIARGGGSLEDLWHFNNETVVRAVANSTIPIISAIGHETDWTLVDYAADLRAPTPTGAAEMSVPVKHNLKLSIASLESRLQETIVRLTNNKTNQFNSLKRAIPTYDQILSRSFYRLDQLSRELEHNIEIIIFRKNRDFKNKAINTIANYPIDYIKNHRSNVIKQQKYIEYLIEQHLRCIRLKQRQKCTTLHVLCEQTNIRISHLHAHIEELLNRAKFIVSYKIKNYHTCLSSSNRILQSLSHRNTLKRGYSIIRITNQNIITKAENLSLGTNILIDFYDGQANAIVSSSPRGDMSKRKNKKQYLENQGDLF